MTQKMEQIQREERQYVEQELSHLLRATSELERELYDVVNSQ